VSTILTAFRMLSFIIFECIAPSLSLLLILDSWVVMIVGERLLFMLRLTCLITYSLKLFLLLSERNIFVFFPQCLITYDLNCVLNFELVDSTFISNSWSNSNLIFFCLQEPVWAGKVNWLFNYCIIWTTEHDIWFCGFSLSKLSEFYLRCLCLGGFL